MPEKQPGMSRSWILTLKAEDFSREEVEEKLSAYTYVGQLEKGNTTNYLHWQIYIEHSAPIRFSTLKKKFPSGHFETRKGTRQEAYDYCTKSDTFQGVSISNGTIDVEVGEENSQVTEGERLRALMLEEGLTLHELILTEPRIGPHLKFLTQLEQHIGEEKFGQSLRDVSVTWLFGDAGVGKSSSIYAEHGFKDVYSVSTYSNPWDSYRWQSILLLDEFVGQFDVPFTLKLWDRYPLLLPARYADKWAAYGQVIVVSNSSFHDIYGHLEKDDPARWRALCRRIASYRYMDEERRIHDLPNPLVVKAEDFLASDPAQQEFFLGLSVGSEVGGVK
ncbi:hypothetical protein [Arsenicicoccus dermatophilus]|uniref:hypothetical protein n=1 Tax=Arsenicicoccus dermatophilus TaxID=1076331 RepID=UPI0039171517